MSTTAMRYSAASRPPAPTPPAVAAATTSASHPAPLPAVRRVAIPVPCTSSVLEGSPEGEEHQALLVVGLGVEGLAQLDAQRPDRGQPAHPCSGREARRIERDRLVPPVGVAGIDEHD